LGAGNSLYIELNKPLFSTLHLFTGCNFWHQNYRLHMSWRLLPILWNEIKAAEYPY